jgi:hypothetical protein
MNESISRHERRLASPPPRLAAVTCVLERSMYESMYESIKRPLASRASPSVALCRRETPMVVSSARPIVCGALVVAHVVVRTRTGPGTRRR